jgi:hypothetical protein
MLLSGNTLTDVRQEYLVKVPTLDRFSGIALTQRRISWGPLVDADERLASRDCAPLNIRDLPAGSLMQLCTEFVPAVRLHWMFTRRPRVSPRSFPDSLNRLR